MRKQDIRLRELARYGDEEAARDLGLKLLHGTAGLARNYQLALRYLEPLLDRRPELGRAAAEAVPLDALITGGRVDILEPAAVSGSLIAAAKLGAFRFLLGNEDVGRAWLTAAAGRDLQADEETWRQLRLVLNDARLMCAERVLELLLAGASKAVTSRLLRAALEAVPESPLFQLKCLELLGDACEGAGADFSLPVALLQQCLDACARRGSAFANYALGSAQVGLACGSLLSAQLATKVNYREGYARLLRAAHAGETRAWYQLFKACADYRSVIANQGAAEFFLERAAAHGQTQAQRLLGARLLKSAATVQDVVAGQNWLVKAAESDSVALAVLQTFFPFSDEARRLPDCVGAIERLDASLSLIIELAAAFHLTLTEAVRIDLSTCAQESSLVFEADGRGAPSLFALPAITDAATAALQRARDYGSLAAVGATGRSFERRRIAALRALFDNFGLSEQDCFLAPTQPRCRNLKQWKQAAQDLLREAGRPEEGHMASQNSPP